MTTESVAPTRQAAAPRSDVAATVARLRRTFATGRTRNMQWRQAPAAQAREADGRERGGHRRALAQDLGRKPFEASLADVASVAGEAKDAAKNVRRWMRRKHQLLELSQLPGRGWVEYEPFGTVLIIGAWNFPFTLTLGPAVGAIAAGNTVVLKPSEVAPASSRVMAELVPALPGLRRDRGRGRRRRGQPGAHRAGLRLPAVHRRHRDRPQGLRRCRTAPDAGDVGTGRQEPGDRVR